MDTLPVLNKTKLKNRTLWFDGDSSYSPNVLHAAFIPHGKNHVFVDEITKDIEQFNRLVPSEQQIKTKYTNYVFLIVICAE